MDKNYDVAIIGAGPAGTSCALALRNSGLKIALIDKSKFPRNKTCGDAIPGPALKFLKEIREEIINEFHDLEHKQRIKSSILYMSNGASLEINWKTDAYNSQRLHFDEFLLNQVKKHTKTSVYEGVKIKSITREEQKINIKSRESNFSITCDMVIGSDGANSIVSKTLSHPKSDKLNIAIALSAKYKNVYSPNDSNEFYLLKDLPGYFWIFPLGDNYFNVGFGTFNQYDSKPINLKKYFREIISEHPIISKKFSDAKVYSEITGFKLPLGGKKNSISGKNFLLTGDAANLIDPLSGHGIDKAIKSGILAAQQIEKCFKQSNFSSTFNADYDSAIYAIYWKELKRNFRLMKLLTHFPWLIKLLYPIVKRNKNLFHKFYYIKKQFTTTNKRP